MGGTQEPIEWMVYYTALDFDAIDKGEHTITVPSSSRSLYICELQRSVDYIFEVASVVRINGSMAIVNRAVATVVQPQERKFNGRARAQSWGSGLRLNIFLCTTIRPNQINFL